MNDEMADRISSLLKQIRLLKNKYDELAAVTGEDFNVFSILGVETDEVRTHSAFLADLLNPQGSHRQGAAFLKLFLEMEHKNFEPDEYKNLETFQVRKEASTDQGRIDILLEKEKVACIVIENKIYAEDQVSQLNRYYQYAKKRFSDSQIKLIYLTLDGSSPDEKSLKAVNGHGSDLSMDDVILMSYREHIINWLEECMKLQEVQRISPIREIVFQYRDLLNELTGQPANRRYSMELKDILIEHKNYELITDLEQAILEFKVYVQLKFWEELEKQILALPGIGKHKEQDKYPSKEYIRDFYLKSRDRYVVQTFYLKSVNWNQYDIALQTATEPYGNPEPDYIYFGFILFENGTQVNYCLDKRFDELKDKLGNGFIRDNNKWLVWKWPEQDIGFPVVYPNPMVDDLLNNNKREEVVKELVSEIADAVTRLKENLE